MFDRLKYRWNHNQKGSSLVMLATGMSALMFVGGVVIDLGSYYSQVSRLQNAADAAAAAGAAVYVDKGTTRIVPITNNMDEEDGFTYNMDGQSFTFKSSDHDKETADSMAAHYVAENSVQSPENIMTTRLWVDESNTTSATGSSVSYTNAYAYRVDLNDTAELYFSRIFGMDSYPVSASAMALFVTEPDEENIDDFVKDTNANIFNTIPNYYWESLYYTNKFDVTTTKTETGESTSYTTTEKGVGSRVSSYFIDAYNSYIKDIATTETLTRNNCPLAYSNGTVGLRNISIYDYIHKGYTDINTEGYFCGEPIVGTNNRNLYVLTYTLNEALMKKAKDQKEITGIFMDFPNTGTQQNARALKMNITGENLGSGNPLYVRFESEPRIVGSGLGVTLVHPIIIDVKEKQSRPLVLAYDGPDQNRTEVDSPRVRTSDGFASVGADSSDGLSNGSLASNWAKTSATTSAPFMVNLDSDFNGVIYAPYSTVYITGSGKVVGFIMAAAIVDKGTRSEERTRLSSHEISLPTWGATYKHNNGMGYSKTGRDGKTYYYDSEFNYTTKYITGTYEVVYDEFHNFTNTGT